MFVTYALYCWIHTSEIQILEKVLLELWLVTTSSVQNSKLMQTAMENEQLKVNFPPVVLLAS